MTLRSDGDGTQSRDLCYIENIVNANILAANYNKKFKGKCYNVACGDRISNNEILEYIKSDEKLFVTNFEDVDVEAIEFSPAPGSKITSKTLNEIKFPSSFVVGAINHRGHVSIAHGDTQITEEDSVLIFCQPKVLSKVEKLFN